jgi:rsbT co-antagonist protein RsbR
MSASTIRLDSEHLLTQYQLTPADLDRIRAYGRVITPRVDEYVKHFYSWLETQPEFELFADTNRLQRVQKLQIQYWKEFFEAQIDQAFVDKRIHLGQTHATIGLPLQAYFAALDRSLTIFVRDLYDGSLAPEDYSEAVQAVTRLVHLDTAIVVDTYTARINETITSQSRALMQMSTPVTGIWEGILMLPVVGIIDSKRAQDMMNVMLSRIAETQSKAMILDISGVAVVDTAVANHLIKITKATKLMGCNCIISGVSPAIAQTIVELGIDVGTIRTTATLKDALEITFADTGVVLANKR